MLHLRFSRQWTTLWNETPLVLSSLFQGDHLADTSDGQRKHINKQPVKDVVNLAPVLWVIWTPVFHPVLHLNSHRSGAWPSSGDWGKKRGGHAN